MRRILLALVLVLLSVLPSQAALGYCAPITIDHTQVGASDSTNFPIFFGGNAALKTVANGGLYVQLSNAHDVQFFSDVASTLLDYEFVTWDATTGLGEWHIRQPTLSHSADGTIYVCVGDAGASDRSNATGVWNSAYKQVYHFADGSTLALADSTSNGLTLTNNNSVSAATGQLDGSAQFASASSKWLSRASVASGAVFTLEAWFKHPTVSDQRTIARMDDEGSNRLWIFRLENGTGVVRFYGAFGGGFDISSGSRYDDDAWHQAVGVVSNAGGTGILYVDGSQVATQTSGTINSGTATMGIGSTSTGNSEFFNGRIDEFRFSNTNRSADWITAEYNNQKASSTLLSLGSFTATGGGGGGSTPQTLPLLGVGPGQ